MSTQFDTALGFIIVMSIVSLLIMVATQMWSAFFGLRGLNLADALETMLHKLAPEIHEDGCRQLITDVLTHPAISDSTVSLRRPGLLSRMMPAFLRLRWSRATAVRPDELGQMLRTVSTGPLAAIHRILPQMERNLREAIAAEGGALPERIAALRTVETAITHLGATVNNVFNKTLSSKEVSQQVGSLLEGARPVGAATGLTELRDAAAQGLPPYHGTPGVIVQRDLLSGYASHLKKLVDLSAIRPLTVAVDAGNGMAGHTVPKVFEGLPLTVVPLYFQLDGTFPNHEANPIEPANLRDLQRAVIDSGADIGLAL